MAIPFLSSPLSLVVLCLQTIPVYYILDLSLFIIYISYTCPNPKPRRHEAFDSAW